jgi:hypothetical protein
MKTTQTDRFFTPLSSTEAETINGGDGLSGYIGGISAATGAYQFLPFWNNFFAVTQFEDFSTGGSTAQLNGLLAWANFLTGF